MKVMQLISHQLAINSYKDIHLRLKLYKRYQQHKLIIPQKAYLIYSPPMIIATWPTPHLQQISLFTQKFYDSNYNQLTNPNFFVEKQGQQITLKEDSDLNQATYYIKVQIFLTDRDQYNFYHITVEVSCIKADIKVNISEISLNHTILESPKKIVVYNYFSSSYPSRCGYKLKLKQNPSYQFNSEIVEFDPVTGTIKYHSTRFYIQSYNDFNEEKAYILVTLVVLLPQAYLEKVNSVTDLNLIDKKIYTDIESTYTLPERIFDIEGVNVLIEYNAIKDFTLLNGNIFEMNPKKKHVGTYQIGIKFTDSKDSGITLLKKSFKIEVVETIEEVAISKCPLQNQESCLPIISMVSQVGRLEITFPVNLKVWDSQYYPQISQAMYLQLIKTDQARNVRIVNWTVQEYQKKKITLDLKFNQPLLISTSLHNDYILKVNQTIQEKIPPQMLNTYAEQTLIAAFKVFDSTLVSTIVTNLALSVFLGVALKQIWYFNGDLYSDPNSNIIAGGSIQAINDNYENSVVGYFDELGNNKWMRQINGNDRNNAVSFLQFLGQAYSSVFVQLTRPGLQYLVINVTDGLILKQILYQPSNRAQETVNVYIDSNSILYSSVIDYDLVFGNIWLFSINLTTSEIKMTKKLRDLIYDNFDSGQQLFAGSCSTCKYLIYTGYQQEQFEFYYIDKDFLKDPIYFGQNDYISRGKLIQMLDDDNTFFSCEETPQTFNVFFGRYNVQMGTSDVLQAITDDVTACLDLKITANDTGQFLSVLVRDGTYQNSEFKYIFYKFGNTAYLIKFYKTQASEYQSSAIFQKSSSAMLFIEYSKTGVNCITLQTTQTNYTLKSISDIFTSNDNCYLFNSPNITSNFTFYLGYDICEIKPSYSVEFYDSNYNQLTNPNFFVQKLGQKITLIEGSDMNQATYYIKVSSSLADRDQKNFYHIMLEISQSPKNIDVNQFFSSSSPLSCGFKLRLQQNPSYQFDSEIIQFDPVAGTIKYQITLAVLLPSVYLEKVNSVTDLNLIDKKIYTDIETIYTLPERIFNIDGVNVFIEDNSIKDFALLNGNIFSMNPKQKHVGTYYISIKFTDSQDSGITLLKKTFKIEVVWLNKTIEEEAISKCPLQNQESCLP
ncbi:UNKNOWN [Stylonychia lemnae]|uniref:Uncharacterized protein n=1 Tax=Stylonychia lemnae TaxID=5949 RepID=A0A078B2G4_STYLE|nr:UNKNOWN [Stylonychia lemnae]|eukprot:CDW87407.1 UNKNOWN [Stylonychia lemnae]